MGYREISKILGYFLLAFSAVLLIPLGLASYYQFLADPISHPQPHSVLSFFATFLISLGSSLIFLAMGRSAEKTLYRREGIAIVVLIWFLTPAFAALPFIFSGTLSNPAQAYYEAASGLSTTGATMLCAKEYDLISRLEIPIRKSYQGIETTNYQFYGTVEPVREKSTGKILFTGIEAVGKAILFWRSFIQWLGGLGIVVLFVAVLPALGVGGRLLYQTEVPGLRKESLTPRIAEGALIFWKIYAGLTLLQMALLKWTNVKMGWFDALTISLSTVSTGGFSIRNDGIAAYNSAATDWVVILFMLLGSINFSLYYYVLRGKIYRLYDKELLLFFAIVLAACFFASWNLVGTPNASLVEHSDQVPPMGLKEAIRQGSFQVISIQTTAGFNIADYDSWPAIIQCLLLLLMYVGGMTGSTAGGIKVMRLYLMALIIKNRLLLLFRPDTVRKVYFENREFDDSAAVGALSFFFVTIGLSVIGTFLYIMQGVDPETAMGFVASCINNIGTAFRMNGPRGSSAFLSDSGAWMASLLMLLGRLEFFAVLTLLFPSFWKR